MSLRRRIERSPWSPPKTGDPLLSLFQPLHCLQKHATHKAARQTPFGPVEWREHFANTSASAEFLTDDIRQFGDTLPVSQALRDGSTRLDDALTTAEIAKAVRALRPGAGGGYDVSPVLSKLCLQIQSWLMTLSALRETCGGLRVLLWKQKEPFNSMDKWRGGVLLWTIPRMLARMINARGQE